MKRIDRSKLKTLRNKTGYSQKKVVELLLTNHGIKITDSYYGMIEQGVRTPSLQLAIAISKIFDTNPEEIFFSQNNNKTLCNSKEVI
ncbi:helix-turn-helix transcriptional regulator [Oceanobacillus caeni]